MAWRRDLTFLGTKAGSHMVILLAFGALIDCRCRTRYDARATAECKETAMKQAVTSAPDSGGHGEAVAADWDKRCQDCCHAHRLDNIEPGYCECGDLGLDALMK